MPDAKGKFRGIAVPGVPWKNNKSDILNFQIQAFKVVKAEELERFIEKHFGKSYHYVEDRPAYYEVVARKTDQGEVEAWLDGDYVFAGQPWLSDLLNYLCSTGKLPVGEYLIKN